MKLVVFAAFGLYSKLWRFVDQKDVEAIVKAVVVATVVLIAALFLLSLERTDPPRGVIALDFLLTLAFITGSRFLWRGLVERPLRGPLLERAAREVLIVGAGQRRPAGGLRAAPQPRAALGAGGVRGRRPAQAGDARGRAQGARHHRRASARARRREARRGHHRHPVRLRHAAPEDRDRLPRPRHPGAHAAHHLRAALRRREPHAPGARGARRGRARPRAGARGDRPRGRLPPRAAWCS